MEKQKPAEKGASDQTDEQASKCEDSSDANEVPSPDDGLNPVIKPVDKKIGEGRDNLRRREEWFQRRSGGVK